MQYDDYPRREPSIREQMNEMQARLDSVDKAKSKVVGGKVKEYKLPFMTRMSMKSQMKKNRVLCLHLKSSRRAEIKYFQLENGMIVVPDKVHGDKYHNASQSFVWLMNGKIPLYVVKDWCVDPMGDKDYDMAASHVVGSEEYMRDVEAGRLIDPQTITIRAIEAREALMKKPMSGLIWILVLVGVAVVGFLIFSNVTKKG